MIRCMLCVLLFAISFLTYAMEGSDYNNLCISEAFQLLEEESVNSKLEFIALLDEREGEFFSIDENNVSLLLQLFEWYHSLEKTYDENNEFKNKVLSFTRIKDLSSLNKIIRDMYEAKLVESAIMAVTYEEDYLDEEKFLSIINHIWHYEAFEEKEKDTLIDTLTKKVPLYFSYDLLSRLLEEGNYLGVLYLSHTFYEGEWDNDILEDLCYSLYLISAHSMKDDKTLLDAADKIAAKITSNEHSRDVFIKAFEEFSFDDDLSFIIANMRMVYIFIRKSDYYEFFLEKVIKEIKSLHEIEYQNFSKEEIYQTMYLVMSRCDNFFETIRKKKQEELSDLVSSVIREFRSLKDEELLQSNKKIRGCIKELLRKITNLEEHLQNMKNPLGSGIKKLVELCGDETEEINDLVSFLEERAYIYDNDHKLQKKKNELEKARKELYDYYKKTIPDDIRFHLEVLDGKKLKPYKKTSGKKKASIDKVKKYLEQLQKSHKNKLESLSIAPDLKNDMDSFLNTLILHFISDQDDVSLREYTSQFDTDFKNLDEALMEHEVIFGPIMATIDNQSYHPTTLSMQWSTRIEILLQSVNEHYKSYKKLLHGIKKAHNEKVKDEALILLEKAVEKAKDLCEEFNNARALEASKDQNSKKIKKSKKNNKKNKKRRKSIMFF